MPFLERLAPRYVAELFAPLHHELIAVLRGLAPSDWDRPPVAGAWRVRDVAAHLLDGDLRKLAGHRDGHPIGPDRPFRNYGDIVDFINAINASGVAYAQRLSPKLLPDLLDATGRWVAGFVEGLEPHAPAAIPVAWAGESQSENWMDTGREYTERWHHQMQIRDAVEAPGLLDVRWLSPLLDFSVRALPPAYADTEAPEGAAIAFSVTGDAGWAWTLVREGARWELYRGESEHPATTVRMDARAAWRLFYNALPPQRAREELTVSGDESLAEPLIRVRSVMV